MLQFLFGRRQRRAREDNAADGVHIGDLGELRCAIPSVDRQGQRPAHSSVVERLSLVVGLHEAAAVPVALLNRDLVTERADELVAHRWRKPAELDGGTVAADRVDPHRLLRRVDRGEAVEEG